MLNRALDEGGPVDVPHVLWPSAALDAGVFQRFVLIASQAPLRIAVTAGAETCTYEALERHARQLAGCLAAGEEPVAVWLPPGPALAAAFLACQASGRPCVPLDPAWPVERTRAVLEHAQATAMMVDPTVLPVPPLALPLQYVDVQHARTAPPLEVVPGRAESVAYIIYTSGSTGRPKGVFQSQRGLLHDIMQYSHSIHLHAADELSGLYPPSVSGAIRDIYAALLNGAGLHFFSPVHLGLVGLAEAVEQAGITVLHIIPPLLRAFLPAVPPQLTLHRVRLVYLAGDRLFRQDIERLYHVLRHRPLLYIGIGSTENATLFRQWFVRPETVLDSPLVPVGYALADRECRVLGPDGAEVPVGEAGELETASPFLALGYWCDPAATAAAFYPDPARPHWRRFRTGDLGRMRADGLLEFVGRADGQVKIRGFRVEIGHVEAALRAVPGVTDAAVLVVDHDAEPQLVAWAETGEPLERIAAALRLTLPQAAVPARLFCLSRLPRLSNFKCDRQALLQLVAGAGRDPARDDRVTSLWCDVLRLSVAAPESTFADSGGNSLALLTLRSRLQQELGFTLHPARCTPELTLADLQREYGSRAPALAPILYVLAGLTGTLPGMQTLEDTLAPRVLVRPLVLPGLVDELTGPATMERLVAHVVAAIVKDAPTGPVHLLGLSFGCRVMADVAVQLPQVGIQVGRVLFADNSPFVRSEGLRVRLHRLWQTGRWRSPGWMWPVLVRHGLMPWPLVIQRAVLRGLRRRWPRAAARVERQWLIQRRLAARRTWQPPRLAHIVVLSARSGLRLQQDLPADLGWGQWATRVDVIKFEGGHPGHGSDIGCLAAAVRDVLLPAP